MSGGPLHVCQQLLRRVGETFRRKRLQGATRAWNYERGKEQVAVLVSEVEARTGASVAGRRALDFGCGSGRLALPLAERCEHVHGLDVEAGVLRLAESNAREHNVSNVSWGEAHELASLTGQYDFVFSMNVLQHIPSREGEKTFVTLVRGLQPGGIGIIQVLLRPQLEVSRLLERDYLYNLVNGYSLRRLGRLLHSEGISPWHARARRSSSANGAKPSDEVIFFFQKPDSPPA
jgi:2-polyprenyl-3-methyl-5-hydroxy-6-metoxy-1,4-benzoquinol methylase